MELHLNMYLAAGVAALVYYLGAFVVSKVPFLQKYCIPAPVIGGLIFSLVNWGLNASGVLLLTYDKTLQNVFMMIFFASVGFTACFKLLKKGGKQIFIFLFISIILCFAQNFLGCGVMALFGQDPRLGVCVGSTPLVGGTGTSGAFGPLLEETYGVEGATVVAIASAAFGMVAGSLMGGPMAISRIRKHNLHSEYAITGADSLEGEAAVPMNTGKFIHATMFMAMAVGFGSIISKYLTGMDVAGIKITFPSYIGGMLVAMVIRNIADASPFEFPVDEIDCIGSMSLNIYLSLALMSMELWKLVDLAVPMVVCLILQCALMWIFGCYICWWAMGKNYDAAVLSSGMCGFGMGATPNAMANMNALCKIYGPCPTAFFVVPLVGGMFIDFFNALIITGFVNLV